MTDWCDTGLDVERYNTAIREVIKMSKRSTDSYDNSIYDLDRHHKRNRSLRAAYS